MLRKIELQPASGDKLSGESLDKAPELDPRTEEREEVRLP